MEINRRDFVKLIGTAVAGLAIGGGAGAIMKLPKSLEPVLYSGPRMETWKLTACGKCPGGCSINVRLIDKFPIQAFGNPLSPINDGGICSIGLTSISGLYHPSRITGPLKKVNGKFVSISYNEAYNILSENLKNIIKQNRQDDVFIIAQTDSALRADIFKRFSKETEIKNLILDNYEANSLNPYYEAAGDAPGFIDFEKCDYILNFGAQLSEMSQSPLYFSRSLIDFREKGHKITAAGSKLTGGIFKSDEWIRIQPAQYGDLALGVAYVLLKDELYDKDAEKSIANFSSIKKYILDNYYPDNVEKSTGVPSDTILRIGKRFEKASAPAAYFDESILYSSKGTQNAQAIIILNALKGFKGFGKVKESFYSSIINNVNAAPQNSTFNTFKNALANKSSVKVLMIAGSNFIFNNTDQEALKNQVSSIPFIVSFSSFIDETSDYAHLIIPDHNDLEKLDLNFDESTGYSVITVQQPVVDPFFKTTDTGDVIISLMKDLKPNSEFKYSNVSEYVKSIAGKLYDNRIGTLMTENKFTEIEKGLRKIGWTTDQYGSFDEFWDSLLEAGGWWNPFGDKVQYSPKINFMGNFPPADAVVNNTAAAQSQKKLVLNVFLKNLDYRGSMSLNPVLIEQFGHQWSVFYKTWVEINPITARRFSIGDRSSAVIKTSKGKFPVVVVYNASVLTGNLDVPFGLGHTILGDDSGINPLMFTENIFDNVSGKPSLTETIAEIESSSSRSIHG
jgi:anaerobic selenocysteine-containing dehydrogenase